jgi:hypothetical protein
VTIFLGKSIPTTPFLPLLSASFSFMDHGVGCGRSKKDVGRKKECMHERPRNHKLLPRRLWGGHIVTMKV